MIIVFLLSYYSQANLTAIHKTPLTELTHDVKISTWLNKTLKHLFKSFLSRWLLIISSVFVVFLVIKLVYKNYINIICYINQHILTFDVNFFLDERKIVMTTLERIKGLAKKQGKSLNKIEEDLGYGKNVLYRLKNSNPSTERLQEIADYFDVSVDYLLDREKKKNMSNASLTSDDLNKLLDNVKSFDGKPITENDKEAVRIFLEGRLSK